VPPDNRRGQLFSKCNPGWVDNRRGSWVTQNGCYPWHTALNDMSRFSLRRLYFIYLVKPLACALNFK
jgi:hypothetical protein